MLASFAAWFDSAIWFWLAAGVIWWHVCSITMGLPNSFILRAADDPADADLFDRLARREIALAAQSWRRNNAFWIGVSAFAVAFLAAFAVIQRSPPAAAGFCVIAPLCAHLLVAARTASALDAAQPDAAQLLRRFRALRSQAFAAALSSVSLALILRGATRLSALT